MKPKEIKKRKKDSVFAQNLKKILEERKISQADAARLAGGINRSQINDWLAGTSPQDLQAVQKLATAIHCDFQWLLTGITSQKQQAEDLSLSQLYDVEPDASFSGLYIIEAKKLKRKSNIQKGDK